MYKYTDTSVDINPSYRERKVEFKLTITLITEFMVSAEDGKTESAHYAMFN